MMNSDHPKWELVERIANSLKVARPTVLKWRRRGVPPAQALRIIRASDGLLSISDFLDQDDEETAA